MTTPTIKTHEEDEPGSSSRETFCGICRRQVSRYTCPSCNLCYCSLNCFRAELHSRCSETFYRKEIEIGIKSGSSKSDEDKNKMMELLKQIEDQSVDEDGLFDSDEENEEEDSLVHRFSAIDISSASADDLLRLLNKKERNKFFVALKDPSSRLAQELLESAELDKTRQLPWWEAPTDGDGQSTLSLHVSWGVKPDLMEVPADLINADSRGVSLLYNMCAVLLAYGYVTRHLSMSPLASTTNDPQDQNEARRILSQSVPFLIDRKSKVRHVSSTDAVISFWSQLDPGSVDNKTILILLEDVAKLVRPRRITVTEDSLGEREKSAVVTVDHPSATTIMAISDMSSLFGTYLGSGAVAQRSHIAMKLTYYAAYILSMPPSDLHALADEFHLLAKGMGKEVH